MSDVWWPTVEKLPECHNQTAWIFMIFYSIVSGPNDKLQEKQGILTTIVANCEQPSRSPSSWKAQMLHHMQIYNRSRDAECLYIQSVVTQIKESNLTCFSEVCQLHLRWWLLCAAMGNFCWSSMLANFARVKNHCKILSVICQQQPGILSNYNQVLVTTILETLGICYADTPETSFTAKWRYPPKNTTKSQRPWNFWGLSACKASQPLFCQLLKNHPDKCDTPRVSLDDFKYTVAALKQAAEPQDSKQDHEQKLEEVTKAAFQDLMCDAESDA